MDAYVLENIGVGDTYICYLFAADIMADSGEGGGYPSILKSV